MISLPACWPYPVGGGTPAPPNPGCNRDAPAGAKPAIRPLRATPPDGSPALPALGARVNGPPGGGCTPPGCCMPTKPTDCVRSSPGRGGIKPPMPGCMPMAGGGGPRPRELAREPRAVGPVLACPPNCMPGPPYGGGGGGGGAAPCCPGPARPRPGRAASPVPPGRRLPPPPKRCCCVKCAPGWRPRPALCGAGICT